MIQKPKGTYDVYGKKGKTLLVLEELMSSLMEKYNYEMVRTPLFEASELFHRGVGDTTDIITKETYDFKDKADRLMTLRPEGTAGVVRSFIENKMYARDIMPVKTWYYGPMYRYERPQSGRFREFYQFGVEVFGSTSPLMDAEVISIPVNFYKLLGLKDIKVHINTLGDNESRENYRNALIEYFRPHLSELCSDCNERFLKNPLRILDCKVDKDLDILKNAPHTVDYLNCDSKKHFEGVKEALNALDIEYIEDPNLVRGLDYYTHTVFEVEANVEGFGSQNVLCGGGRYNNLVETIGGPETSGCGFAMGIERLLTALEYENIDIAHEDSIDIFVVPVGEYTKNALSLTNALRMSGFSVDMEYTSKKMAASFKKADKLGAKYIIIIGEDEVKNNILTVKDNHTKEEHKVKFEDLIDFLDEEDECSCGCSEGCGCHNEN